MTRKQAQNFADIANQLEKMVINAMDEEMYRKYMALPREARIKVVIEAMNNTAAALA